MKRTPNNRGFFDGIFSMFEKAVVGVKALRICRKPKIRRAAPPATPTTSFISGSLATVCSVNAKSMTRLNSKIVCPIEKANPPLAPDLVPCAIFAKNVGPGASAPEAVTTTTVAMNVSMSTQTERLKEDN